MAKSSRAKHKGASLHSRAARRAASPIENGLPRGQRDGDGRQAKEIPVKQYGGVTKKRSKAKPLSRAQRLRREKGMDRAEAVLDQLEVKRALSAARSRRVQARSAGWDDLNNKMATKPRRDPSGPQDDDDWEDEVENNELPAEDEQERSAIKAVEALQVDVATSNDQEAVVTAGVTTIAGGDATIEDDIL